MANQLKMAEVQAILALAQRLVQSEHRPPTRRSPGDRWTPHPVVGRRSCGARIGFKTGQRALGSTVLAAGGSTVLAAGGSTVLAAGGSESAPTGLSGAPIGSVSTASPWREVIVQKLEAGLTAQRIYQDISSDHGYAGSYYSVRRFIKKLSAAAPAPFRRMECEPGAEAQVDFGRGAPWSVLTANAKQPGSSALC